MITDKTHEETMNAIAAADDIQVAGLVLFAIQTLGRRGRFSTEKMLEQVEAEGGPDPDLEEGLAQIGSLEGVLTGRTDAL